MGGKIRVIIDESNSRLRTGALMLQHLVCFFFGALLALPPNLLIAFRRGLKKEFSLVKLFLSLTSTTKKTRWPIGSSPSSSSSISRSTGDPAFRRLWCKETRADSFYVHMEV